MISKIKENNFLKRAFAIMFLTLMMFTVVSPVNTFADKTSSSTSNQPGDVNVTISDDGKLSLSGGGFDSTKSSGSAWTEIISKYKGFIVGISGIGTVTMILFFIILFCKLSGTVGNPTERAKVIQGLVWSGVATAGLGSVTLIVSLFYSSL